MADKTLPENKSMTRKFRALQALSLCAAGDDNRVIVAGYEGELPLSDSDIRALLSVGAIEEMK